MTDTKLEAERASFRKHFDTDDTNCDRWEGWEARAAFHPIEEKELRRLIQETTNAAFECGRWDEDEIDMPPYKALFQASREAKEALVAYVLNGQK